MFQVVRVFVMVFVVTCGANSRSQEPDSGASAKVERAERLEFMRQRVNGISAIGPSDEPYQINDTPLLRYNDATRGILDASLWRLGKFGRPATILVLEIYATTAQYELTGTSDLPKAVSTGNWRWTPRKTNFTWTEIPGSGKPGTASRARRPQMKQLAHAFEASEEWRGETYHLRLMPQPIHRYEDAENGILDGAVFVWAHGTNVEILMLIEARKRENTVSHWVAGFSRLAAAALKVKYRNQAFWSSPSTSGSPNGEYFFRTDRLTPNERAAFTSTD